MGFTPQAFAPQAIDLWSMFVDDSGDLPDQKTSIIQEKLWANKQLDKNQRLIKLKISARALICVAMGTPG